jgi:hypothetical protein
LPATRAPLAAVPWSGKHITIELEDCDV